MHEICDPGMRRSQQSNRDLWISGRVIILHPKDAHWGHTAIHTNKGTMPSAKVHNTLKPSESHGYHTTLIPAFLTSLNRNKYVTTLSIATRTIISKLSDQTFSQSDQTLNPKSTTQKNNHTEMIILFVVIIHSLKVTILSVL